MNKAKAIRSEPATTSRPDFFFSYHFLHKKSLTRVTFSRLTPNLSRRI